MNQTPHCTCKHHKIVPVLMIAIGLSFLLARFGIIDGGMNGIIAPALLMLIGLVKLGSGTCGCYMRG